MSLWIEYDDKGEIQQVCGGGHTPEFGAYGRAVMEIPTPDAAIGCYVHDGALVKFPYKPSSKHVFNFSSKQWEDPRTLDDFKAEKWGQAKAHRDAAEFGLFEWAGHSFDGDEAAQRRINLAVMGAQAALIAGDTAWSVDWTLADNTSLTLSASDMIGVANALGANIAQAHALARVKRQQIEAAQTVAELDAL